MTTRIPHLIVLCALTGAALGLVSDARAETTVSLSSPGATRHLYRDTGALVTLTARYRGRRIGHIEFLRVAIDAAGRKVPTTLSRAHCSHGVKNCRWRQVASVTGSWAYQAVFVGRRGKRKYSRIVVVHWTQPPPQPQPPATTATATLQSITQEGAVYGYCSASRPGGAGAAHAQIDAPYGTITYDWSLPGTISAGATASLKTTVAPAPGQRLSSVMGFKSPGELGLTPGPNFGIQAFAESGESFKSAEQSFTFTPERAFTPGEVLYIRVELQDCVAFIYQYVAN